jgi:hypothetical protein
MRHRIFALLDHPEELKPVLAALEADTRCHGQCTVILHRDRLTDDDVSFGETDSMRWLGRGVLFGAVSGGIAGLVLGPLGLVGLGPLASAALGTTAGSLYAGIIGALTGLSEPHHDLSELAEHLEQGGVLLSIDAPSLGARDDVEAVIESHGGRLSHTHRRSGSQG